VLRSGGRPGRPVFGLAAGGRSADRLAAVVTVDLASCKCWQYQLEGRAVDMASGLLCELGGSSVRIGIEGCTPLERGLS
jgi:hypothetical protein